jgi:hypothetical protein
MVYFLREETANSVVPDHPKNQHLEDLLFAIVHELSVPTIDLE